MKYIKGATASRVELTRTNLQVLLNKLDDPTSARTIGKQEELGAGNDWVYVVAVEDEAHYTDRAPGEMAARHLPKEFIN